MCVFSQSLLYLTLLVLETGTIVLYKLTVYIEIRGIQMELSDQRLHYVHINMASQIYFFPKDNQFI